MGFFPVPGDTVEQRVITVAGNQVGMNIFHYGVTTVTTGGASLLEIATAVDPVIAPLYKNLLWTGAQYRGIGFTNLTGVRTIEWAANANAGIGLMAGNPLPTQTRSLISYQGNNAGAANRGRQYIPFPSVLAITASADLAAGYLANLVLLRTHLSATRVIIGVTGTLTMVPVIAHKPHTPSNWAAVFQMFARTKFATQRRSGAYGKPNVPPF